MAEDMSPLHKLPPHILQDIITRGNLDAEDFARLEASSYIFKAASGLMPYRFKSLPELAAFQLCQNDPLFSVMPLPARSKLSKRCEANWKLILRYLHAVQQAWGRATTRKGNFQVVTGKYHTLLLGNGQLFSCGSSQFGVLGHGPNLTQCTSLTAIQLPMVSRVICVSGSHHHVAFLTERGEVFTFGDNSSSCCGHGDVGDTILNPTIVESLKGISCKKVATGLSFTVALTENGEVYTWGSNSHGQLGHGDTNDVAMPGKVAGLSICGLVAMISAGASHTLAVTRDGALYSFGYGANFCLGHGDTANEHSPRLVESLREQNIFLVGIAAGDEHSVALDSSGYVYTWGKGYCGALGHGDELDQRTPLLVTALGSFLSVQVCARKRKTFAVGVNGSVFAFGWMGCGSLGLTGRGSSDKGMQVLPP
ncbi:hypothetical protein O6H91_13G074600 [Diphasiastrum complanatum]|uniref:Uncharacterized protein n=1 Tax=Diphasiastrum complanatum TaxID=34168 RepID=A0ACC2BW31_DIPCM|nr:hypothetical protein O6H91_13G074600 [Diphasiastrum complanatum]